MNALDTLADVRLLRRAFGSFLTGVTVVTTIDADGRPRGFTANSFTSVSLDPPLILVCIARNAASAGVFAASQTIGINILAENQRGTAIKFASKDPDKFETVAWEAGRGGAPRIKKSLAWLECRTSTVTPAGDHLIILAQVDEFMAGATRPLGYFQGSFVGFDMEDRAIEHARMGSLVLGCIAESDQQILLCRADQQSAWTLPSSALVPGDVSPSQKLQTLLSRLGADVEVSFLFSVFQDPKTGTLYVTHRGRLRRPLAAGREGMPEGRMFDTAALPWNDLMAPGVANMLRRYLQERTTGRFAVYTEYDDHRLLARLHGDAVDWIPANND